MAPGHGFLTETVTIGVVFLFGVSFVALAFRAMELGREFEIDVKGPRLALHLRVTGRRKSIRRSR